MQLIDEGGSEFYFHSICTLSLLDRDFFCQNDANCRLKRLLMKAAGTQNP